MLKQRNIAGRTLAVRNKTFFHPAAAVKVDFRPIGAVDVTRTKKLDRDEGKEQARRYRRTTFDLDQWAAHRSTNRYLRHVRGVLSSRIARGLSGPLTYVGVISLGVCAYETALEGGALPEWGFTWPRLAVEIAGPFSLSTFALSLLLVFRTNSSYQRWNEARKLWGTLINRSRDLARQTQQWVTPTEPELADTLCRWIVAFPLILMASLREDVELQQELQGVLLLDELQLVLQQQHPASAALQALGQCVALSNAKDIEKLRMDESIASLQDVLGGCERIFRTPIPLTYTRHLTRFLVVWLTALPFCVAHTMGWATVPITIALAFFLFGIEEIGVQIEEPFGILALEGFCATTASNVAQAQAAADKMRQTAIAHGATAASRQLVPQLPVTAAAGSDANSSVERVSGGYTLPRSPAAVSNVLVEEEMFADKALGWGTADDSDSGF